jgi:hypothetical protein
MSHRRSRVSGMSERLLDAPQRGMQAGNSLRLQPVIAPVVERGSESRPLLGVELDSWACAHRFEPFADRLRSLGEGEFLEQDVAVGPCDLDDFASDVDVHATWAVGLHEGRAYTGAAA